MRIIFATNNINKLNEIRAVLADTNIEVVSMNEIGFLDDIEETGATLEENALLKAQTIFKKYHLPVFSDDSGLLIDALNGEPGVFSARYAGIDKNDDKNMNKVLEKLLGNNNRKAHFKTVIAYVDSEGKPFLFEGKIDGEIMTEKIGNNGFGYDPIFKPNGFDKTFAEMDISEKKAISHRSLALQQMIIYLKNEIL